MPGSASPIGQTPGPGKLGLAHGACRAIYRSMNIFDDRQRGFEEDWARQAEFDLRVHARRNRLLAEWAARSEGAEGNDWKARVRALIKLDFAPEGEAALYAEIAESLGQPRSRIEEKAAGFEEQARQSLEG